MSAIWNLQQEHFVSSPIKEFITPHYKQVWLRLANDAGSRHASSNRKPTSQHRLAGRDGQDP